jgi:hypothetical protein
MFAQFGAPFSKATKFPAGMAREVTKMKRKHAMIVHLKAQAAAGLAAEGDEQKLNEAENPDDNDFIKTYKPIFLDARNFLGTDDADVLNLPDVSKLKAEYDLILLDPPCGKSDQQWDKEAWSED